MTTEKKNFSAMLKGARMPERTVQICLRGDLAAEHQVADEELKQLRQNSSTSMEGNGSAELAERVRLLEAEMRENSYPFRMRALPEPKYRALKAEYPPRREANGELNGADASLGFNMDTFLPALIKAVTYDPVLSEDEWRELLGDDEEEKARLAAAGEPVEEGKLTARQVSDLNDAAYFLNRGEVDIPFSLSASLMNRSSAGE